MNEILTQLCLLGIAVVCNVLCGTYYNVNVKDLNFDRIKMINGIVKAIIIGAIAVGMSTVFMHMPELADTIGVTPEFVINAAVVLYTAKTMVGLGKILGVKIQVNEKEE